jgi:hypothetical protein
MLRKSSENCELKQESGDESPQSKAVASSNLLFQAFDVCHDSKRKQSQKDFQTEKSGDRKMKSGPNQLVQDPGSFIQF